MSRDFEEVVLMWKGKEYKIPPDQVLHCLARVETVFSYADLADHALKRATNVSKLSMAFGIMLRWAGADVTDKEVRDDALSNNIKGVFKAVSVLMSLMVSPEHLRAEPGKPKAAGKRRAASSPQRTSSSSEAAG